ncbi:MAG: alpha-N-arabinofuranosidase [Oscillospiraceae bacterium]|jgi:alpha-N-arabinofuranosidase|nr:alpha-N-arabinofuranosidase [Oscillospiraceae bacterium]
MDAKILLDKSRNVGAVDSRLYGSFIEHLGRAIYGGIYEPTHATADGDGFRTDVIELVRELNVPLVRYPGGNFVSGFRWEDSVGPVEKRPTRLDLAWRTSEPNTIGIGEFAKWCEKANTAPMMAVNLGTRGIESAMDLLEYCNQPNGSYLSDLRVSRGAKAPFDIRVWCLGNEMDGPWQVGHKTATEYGRLAAETAKAMKLFDPTLELVSCGSSSPGMPTFPDWEGETLTHTYDYVDYISLHQYFSKKPEDGGDFLASTVELDRFITTVAGICDEIKAKKQSDKTINISFDEWNVWYHSNAGDDAAMAERPWRFAPPLLEDVYTMEDALVAGLAIMTLIRHCDRVKIACLAQLVNVIAPIMTATGGGICRQSIFYPFLHASKFGRGYSLLPTVECQKLNTKSYSDVPSIESAAVVNDEQGELTVFIVNRDITNKQNLTLELGDLVGYSGCTHIKMSHSDLNAVNTVALPDTVKPGQTTLPLSGGSISVTLDAASWNVLRFGR